MDTEALLVERKRLVGQLEEMVTARQMIGLLNRIIVVAQGDRPLPGAEQVVETFVLGTCPVCGRDGLKSLAGQVVHVQSMHPDYSVRAMRKALTGRGLKVACPVEGCERELTRTAVANRSHFIGSHGLSARKSAALVTQVEKQFHLMEEAS